MWLDITVKTKKYVFLSGLCTVQDYKNFENMPNNPPHK